MAAGERLSPLLMGATHLEIQHSIPHCLPSREFLDEMKFWFGQKQDFSLSNFVLGVLDWKEIPNPSVQILSLRANVPASHRQFNGGQEQWDLTPGVVNMRMRDAITCLTKLEEQTLNDRHKAEAQELRKQIQRTADSINMNLGSETRVPKNTIDISVAASIASALASRKQK